MEYQEIIYEVKDAAAVITLNRPEKMNAWTLQMDAEYRLAMEDARTREEVRVIVVTGTGRGFCSGADMGLLATAQDGSLGMTEEDFKGTDAAPGTDIRQDFKKPYTFPVSVNKPIIAAINGYAMGLGLVHALFCDIRIASDQAKLSTLFGRRGLIGEHGIAWILPRVVGLGHALDLMLTGRTIDAQEALRLGLVSQVVPHDQLMESALDYARQIATSVSPRSAGVIKRQVWEATLTDLSTAVDLANKEMFQSFQCSDFAEALMAFIERRPAVFSGK